MSPAKMTRVRRRELEREIRRHRRLEYRLALYGLVAVAVVVALIEIHIRYF